MKSLVPLAHYERKYAISPDGFVWNLDRQAKQTETQNPNGYMKVCLNLNGKAQFLLHQLVALHFLPNPYKHEQVNHKNGDKTDNRVSNLEWVSASENIQHSLETSLRAGYLAKQEKAALVSRVLAGELIKDLAREIGRGPESLSGMLRRHAEEIGKGEMWKAEMRRRRQDVAIRNLEAVNS